MQPFALGAGPAARTGLFPTPMTRSAWQASARSGEFPRRPGCTTSVRRACYRPTGRGRPTGPSPRTGRSGRLRAGPASGARPGARRPPGCRPAGPTGRCGPRGLHPADPRPDWQDPQRPSPELEPARDGRAASWSRSLRPGGAPRLLLDEDHVQETRAMDALDALQLDVASRRGSADPRLRPGWRQTRQRFRNAAHDLTRQHDADMQIGQQAERPATLVGPTVEDDRAGFRDRHRAARDRAIKLVEIPERQRWIVADAFA